MLASYNDVDIFVGTKTYNDLIQNVSRRLNTKTPLENSEISVMWDECRYQQAYHLNKPSPWCAVSFIYMPQR